MELNLRTIVFICLALVLFVYNNIPEKDDKQNQDFYASQANFQQKQKQMTNLLFENWMLNQGDFTKSMELVLQKKQAHEDLTQKNQEVIFTPDKSLYLKSTRYLSTKNSNGQPKFELKKLGYWHLEGDFLFILLKGQKDEIETVKIFQIKEVNTSQINLEEIRKYDNYQEFRKKIDKHTEKISQCRKKILQTQTLSEHQKKNELSKLQDEFFNYPN